MQTTQDLLQKKLIGKKLIICQACKKSAKKFDYSIRDIEELQEVGLVCPHCSEWYHSYFVDKELKDAAPKNGDRQQRRVYQSRFNKFQKKQRKRFKMRKINGRWISGTSKSKSNYPQEDEDQASSKRIVKAA